MSYYSGRLVLAWDAKLSLAAVLCLFLAWLASDFYLRLASCWLVAAYCARLLPASHKNEWTNGELGVLICHFLIMCALSAGGSKSNPRLSSAFFYVGHNGSVNAPHSGQNQNMHLLVWVDNILLKWPRAICDALASTNSHAVEHLVTVDPIVP
jgi:hypothetical protein